MVEIKYVLLICSSNLVYVLFKGYTRNILASAITEKLLCEKLIKWIDRE